MTTKIPRATASALFLVLCLTQNAAHAEMDNVVREALALTEAGQNKQAYDMLEPLEVTRAGDPDFDTVFGIAANQSGQHSRAVMALERATTVQPENARARAELGRAMFAVGDSKTARTLLEQAKAQGAPAEAALTIDQFLRAIDAAEDLVKSSWKGYVEASLGHDSNVNSGPVNANVATPAFGGVTLLNNAIKHSAGFANLAGAVSGRYVVDSRWSVIGNAGINARINGGTSQFNNDQFNLGAGAAYRFDRQEFSGVAVHEEYKLDGAVNRIQNGLVAEWIYRINDTHEAGAYLQHSKLRYPGNTQRNATRTVLGGSFARQFGAGWLAWGGVYFGNENETAAGVPQFGHSLAGLRTGVQKVISPALV